MVGYSALMHLLTNYTVQTYPTRRFACKRSVCSPASLSCMDIICMCVCSRSHRLYRNRVVGTNVSCSTHVVSTLFDHRCPFRTGRDVIKYQRRSSAGIEWDFVPLPLCLK